MKAMDKTRLKRATKVAQKVAQVIAEHPDLPLICLAPSTPSDYDTYYHDVTGASVRTLLFPNEVNKLYSFPFRGLSNGIAFGYFGLNPERYYDDMDEVAEEIEDWLWESTDVGTNEHGTEAYDMHAWIKVYRPIARMMAEDMPWHEYIVIDCY